jgi:hypothetical protein
VVRIEWVEPCLPRDLSGLVLIEVAVYRDLQKVGDHRAESRLGVLPCAPILSVGSGAHSCDPIGDRTGGGDLGAVPLRLS